ncbi:MAG: metallopeptidase TldD-related protein [Candidatus Hermodarchaeota archaeon]
MINEINVDGLIKKALARGADEIEFFFQLTRTIELSRESKNRLQGMKKKDSGVAIRVIKDKKLGIAIGPVAKYDELIEDAFKAIKYYKGRKFLLPKPIGPSKTANTSDPDLENLTVNKLESYLYTLNEEILSDPNIKSQRNEILKVVTEALIVNSTGLFVKKKDSWLRIVALIAAEEDSDKIWIAEETIAQRIKNLDLNELGTKIRQMASYALNSVLVSQNDAKNFVNWDVLWHPQALAELLIYYLIPYISRPVKKGHENLFNERVSIVDDPYLKNGLNNQEFDDEGTKTKKKTLVDSGLHINSLGVGNRFRADYNYQLRRSYRFLPTVFPTNLSIKVDYPQKNIQFNSEKCLYIRRIVGAQGSLLSPGDFAVAAPESYIITPNSTKLLIGLGITGNIGELFHSTINVSPPISIFPSFAPFAIHLPYILTEGKNVNFHLN